MELPTETPITRSVVITVVRGQKDNFACGFEDKLRQYPRAASAARFASHGIPTTD
jgi:hypothetical protein